MDSRFFKVIDGPVWDKFVTIIAQRKIAAVAIRKFMKAVGAVQCYGTTPSSYMFDFKDAKSVDKNLWAKTKPRRGQYFFRPARTPAGKLIAEQIKSLPAAPSADDCIREAGLYNGFPVLIGANSIGYSPHLRFYSLDDHLLIIQVPWKDVDAKDMAKYKRDNAKGIHMSAEMDYLQWNPPQSLVEIKEWEALKLIDSIMGDKK